MRTNRPATSSTERQRPVVHRQRYPQSTLLRSLLDRRLMGLADRGGSSGYVGDSWGVHCAEWLRSNTGNLIRVNDVVQGVIQNVLDVDGIPGLASFASHRGLQNPDFLIGLENSDGEHLLVPVDAKFSVETAKPKQVSAEMGSALIDAEGSPVAPLVVGESTLTDGFFLSPDYELTHQVLSGRVGILRTAVDRGQVHLLAAPSSSVLGREEVRALSMDLAAIDRSRKEAELALTYALYYVRCAFSCAGAHSDVTKPLLGFRESERVDLDRVRIALGERSEGAHSAWTVVQQWDTDAEEIRIARISVHQAAEVGIPTRDLRPIVESTAAKAGIVAPSLNRVRRELAHWSTAAMVESFGTIYHPIEDFEGMLARLRSAAKELQADLPAQVRSIVLASGET